MSDAPDGRVAEVAHTNRVTQAGFTMIPNAVMLRDDLRPVSKLIYGYLKHLAWRAHSDEAAPLRSVICRDLNLTEKTVTAAIRELQKAGLIVARRRGLGKTNVYGINDPESTETEPSEWGETPLTDGENSSVPARARSLARSSKTLQTRDIQQPEPRTVDRKPVKEAEYNLATTVLNEWNLQTGQSLTAADWLRRIIMRIREHPELGVDEHAHIIAATLNDPWWRGAASPSVVYGNGAIFEKSLMAAAGNLGPRQQTTGDRIEATIAQLRREGR